MKQTILDVCCGSRGFWFNPNDDRAVFCDKRAGSYPLGDRRDPIIVRPDLKCDFSALPFRSDTFETVIFDPPHVKRNGALGDITKRYGFLIEGWQGIIQKGFQECFRVLKSHGLLVFKWSSVEIPLNQILELAKSKPIIGHRTGKKSNSHWLLFKGSDN